MTAVRHVARFIPDNRRYGPHYSLRVIGLVDNEFAKLRREQGAWRVWFADGDCQRFCQAALRGLDRVDVATAARIVRDAADAWHRGG